MKLTTGMPILNLQTSNNWYSCAFRVICLTDHHMHTTEQSNISYSEDLKKTYEQDAQVGFSGLFHHTEPIPIEDTDIETTGCIPPDTSYLKESQWKHQAPVSK